MCKVNLLLTKVLNSIDDDQKVYSLERRKADTYEEMFDFLVKLHSKKVDEML